ncbi:MAG: sulfatase-like hydrolase/transferase, partial [Planctomycetota bacterium]
MPKSSCRSFLTVAAAAAASGASILRLTQGADVISGSDQTKTDRDKASVWRPFKAPSGRFSSWHLNKKSVVNRSILLVLALVFVGATALAQEPEKRPNVLLIGVDDLNDWIGCLGGHPQAKSPNMVCNPSRASLMTSLYPSTSGIYFLNPDLSESPVARKSTLMPQRFQDEGYYVTGAGKLFHGSQNQKYLPNYGGSFGGFGPRPEKKISPFPGHPLWDWGAYPERDEQMPDHKIANWAEDRLAQLKEQPLWMGVGFYRPHVPQFAPQKWFDLYPMDTLQLPKTIADDLEDIPQYGIDITRLKHVAPTHEWVLKNDQWKALVQSYLACVSFVDAQVG